MQGLLADLLSERTKYWHDAKVNKICIICEINWINFKCKHVTI